MVSMIKRIKAIHRADVTTNEDLKRDMNAHLKKEYGIDDKKDNSNSQGRRHQ